MKSNSIFSQAVSMCMLISMHVRKPGPSPSMGELTWLILLQLPSKRMMAAFQLGF
jgi:hypothetical protein